MVTHLLRHQEIRIKIDVRWKPVTKVAGFFAFAYSKSWKNLKCFGLFYSIEDLFAYELKLYSYL